ncbi:oligosaccharide flippase family protein [Cellvibrio sp. KY-GH-1]|uniref:oligosaccharide flippase family protein n=1 Tax=Cellvibrio sp. KY-GH-1 TaxID=2303332 RepID=UPI0012451B80|nr:oligosaccharide flippase family protein [Cellvibrio sp. KY-GH-1]
MGLNKNSIESQSLNMASTSRLMLRGATLRVIKTLAGIIIGFLMMPFLLNELGTHLYGLWITIGSVVASYYLLDLGFSQAVTRYVARYIHQKDYVGANRIITTSLLIYSGLGLLVVILSFFIARFGVDHFVQNKDDIQLVQILLIISGISLAFEFPAKAFPGVISAYMRFDTIAIVGLIKTIADALFIYAAIKAGYGLVAMSLIVFCTSILSTVFYVYYCTRIFADLSISINHFEKGTAKELFHFSKWVFVNDLNALLKGKMDIWFIAYFTTLSTVTIYYVAVRLVEYAVQFLIQATGMSSPLYAKYHALEDHAKLAFAVELFLKINIILGSVISAGFYILGDNFIRLWMGSSFEVNTAYICLVIIGCGRMISFMTYPFGSLLLTVKRHDITAKVAIAETILAAVLSIVLIPRFQLMGAAIAIAIPLVLGRVFVISVYAARFVEIAWPKLIARIIIFISIAVAVSIYLRNLVTATDSYMGFAIMAVGTGGVLVLIAVLSLFNLSDMKFIVSKLKSGVKR